MNPFGVFDAIHAAAEIAFGRRRKESRRDRIRFTVFYVLLLLAGIGACIFAIWQLYFQR